MNELCSLTCSLASRNFIINFKYLVIFLKLRIGYLCNTPKPPIIVVGCPKISFVQCIWGRIFEPLGKKSFLEYVSFGFYLKHIWKNIFCAPIPFKRYQNTSGCSTVQYLVVEIQQLCT